MYPYADHMLTRLKWGLSEWTPPITHYVWTLFVCNLKFLKITKLKCLMWGRPAGPLWFCCMASICVHVFPSPSFRTSLSICPLLSVCLSSTRLCLSSHSPSLSLSLSLLLCGGSCWLHTFCLLPAEWMKLPLLEWCHNDSAILDPTCVCVQECMEVFLQS